MQLKKYKNLLTCFFFSWNDYLLDTKVKMIPNIKPLNMIEPDYITLTDYERNFDPVYWRMTIRDNFMVSVYLAALYLVLAFGGAYLMKNRKPFQLNGMLTVWNILLSIMSIWAFSRSVPEFMDHLTSGNGLYYTVCEW